MATGMMRMLRGISLAGLLCASAAAQMGDGSQAVAMGSGRMVRGTVTAAAADHITLKTETGEVYEVALTPNTQIRKGRDQLKVADVHAGDGIGAMGEVDPAKKTVHALFVQVVDAEQLKKAREAMGKTFISGTVTAIDDVKLTIKRSDDVMQVIEVDEDTSFKKGGRAMQLALAENPAAGTMGGFGGGYGGGRGQRQGAPAAAPAGANDGESVTLADVKVGSLVAGTGTIKKGVFVPTTLAIADPGAPRQRRRPEGAAPGSPTSPPANPTTTPPAPGTGPGTEPK